MTKYDLIVPMFDDFGEDELDVTPKKYLVPSLLKSLNEKGRSQSAQEYVVYVVLHRWFVQTGQRTV